MPELLRTASLPLLAGLVLAFFVAWTLAGLAFGFALERFVHKPVFALPLAAGSCASRRSGNLVFLAVTTVTVTARSRFQVVRLGPASLARDLGTFGAMLVTFQIFYWFLHRAMHARSLSMDPPLAPPFARDLAAHRAIGELRRACLWMLGYVGLPILLSRIAPLGFYGWAGYLAFSVLGNVAGHANAEPTLAAGGTRVASLFANPFVYHSLHHARWTGTTGSRPRGWTG
ncbi:MAG: hypothetical protein IPJ34_03005 [Myxococcales bacterium]|nr:hypothetical protein [Myxococcales bacterium]